MPIPRPLATGYSYYLVATKPSVGMSGVRRFRDWLLSICPPAIAQVA